MSEYVNVGHVLMFLNIQLMLVYEEILSVVWYVCVCEYATVL